MLETVVYELMSSNANNWGDVLQSAFFLMEAMTTFLLRDFPILDV